MNASAFAMQQRAAAQAAGNVNSAQAAQAFGMNVNAAQAFGMNVNVGAPGIAGNPNGMSTMPMAGYPANMQSAAAAAAAAVARHSQTTQMQAAHPAIAQHFAASHQMNPAAQAAAFQFQQVASMFNANSTNRNGSGNAGNNQTNGSPDVGGNINGNGQDDSGVTGTATEAPTAV